MPQLPTPLSRTPGPWECVCVARVGGMAGLRDSRDRHLHPSTLISRWRGRRGPGGQEEGEEDCRAQSPSCARERERRGLPSSLRGSGDSGM